MPPTSEFTGRFERALKRKKQRAPQLADAVIETVDRLLNDPGNRGLNQHLVDREARIWEAYASDAIRVTFHHEGDVYTFRNNCDHRIVDRRQV